MRSSLYSTKKSLRRRNKRKTRRNKSKQIIKIRRQSKCKNCLKGG